MKPKISEIKHDCGSVVWVYSCKILCESFDPMRHGKQDQYWVENAVLNLLNKLMLLWNQPTRSFENVTVGTFCIQWMKSIKCREQDSLNSLEIHFDTPSWGRQRLLKFSLRLLSLGNKTPVNETWDFVVFFLIVPRGIPI